MGFDSAYRTVMAPLHCGGAERVYRPITRRRYSAEFKLQAVQRALVAGVNIPKLAIELGVKVPVLYGWLRKYRANPEQAFPGKGATRRPPVDPPARK